MGLFGDYAFKQETRPRVTLLEMAKEKFNDPKLIEEIKLYLASRREQRNYPSRTSWKLQLDLLEKIPTNKRITQVRTSTTRGYRSIAFENKDTTNVVLSRKTDKNNISEKGF